MNAIKNNQCAGADKMSSNNTNNRNTKLSLTEKGPAQIFVKSLII